MHDLIQHLLTVFLGFFAIMNPVANTAVFIGLTAKESKAARSRIARKSLIISFCIVTAFAVLGKTIFHVFGITLPALRITGGILVFQVGYEMLKGVSSKMHTSDEESDVDIAISPLAVPLLAGPGTIATAMNFSAAKGSGEIIVTVAMFALLCVITYIFFFYSEKTMKTLGKSGMDMVTRLMGLILAVIATDMFIEGVYGAVEAFGQC